MGKCKVFDNWTWMRNQPKPFDTVPNRYTDVRSKYSASSATSTLHAPTLSAILAYMSLDHAAELAPTEEAKGAIGTQSDNFVIAEYPSHKGLTHVVVFNSTTGKFTAAKMEDANATPKNYVLKETGDSGAALFFALMPTALQDDEFMEKYQELWECRKAGYPDMDKAAKAAAVCCDNLYRRIENPSAAGTAGIRLNIPNTGNITPFTALAFNKGTYNPTSTILGTFTVMDMDTKPKHTASVKVEDFVDQYIFSDTALTEEEEALVPKLPSWYVIPPQIVTACKHIKATTGSSQPMRNFMFRGPAGTGKTEGVKAMAAGLHKPYVFITCNANFEIYDFLGQMMPDTAPPLPELSDGADLPLFQDIQMDPATAYYDLTGEYKEDVTEEEAFSKLVEVMAARMNKRLVPAGQQTFHYVDTPLIEAFRKGYVCEVQEPTVIANPGVMVGLNSLLDRCDSITLPTGEKVQRHPDCVIVVTTNIGYEGCRDMNQSVISRMNLIVDFDQPDINTMVSRVSKITGCTDKGVIRQMAECMNEIRSHCRDAITDGSCGVRELIAWVQSYMIEGDILEAARYTVLAAISSDAESREDVQSSCLLPRFAP